MNKSPDIIFLAEYIKNILYFATVRQGKVLKSTADIHYFSIDNELVYENYYSDFGPLNLGCVFKYCKILNDKINQYLNKQTIVHYTSDDSKKKSNSAYLLGCYGVLYLSLTPRDALKPLLVHGQRYRPFQDATQGDSDYTISLLDCLQAIKKARELGFFNFQDFNYEEYERLDKIQGGDLNWIVPGKFLALIGPVDYSVSLYHPPEMYINYFLENNVKIVIRLNRRLYDGNVFNNVGIVHYDLFFPDGTCPPRPILLKFLQISEEANCAIAVHCKAGLGRTGSLIGCYLMKHYKMTSHEAIGWMRICRPGSVIGHQQEWLEKLESWLIKMGNIYRKNMYQDTEKLPYHEYGIYSIAERSTKQRLAMMHKSPSPPPPIKKQSGRINDMTFPVRPQNSRIKEDVCNEDVEENEIYLTSCDLTVKPTGPTKQLKGCVLKATEDNNDLDLVSEFNETPIWKRYLCCNPCLTALNNGLFIMAVRCTSLAPQICNSNILCTLINLVALNKAAEKDAESRAKLKISNPKLAYRDPFELRNNSTQRSSFSAAGDLRAARPTSRNSTIRSSIKSAWDEKKSHASCVMSIREPPNIPITTYRTSHAPIMRNINEAKNYLMRTSIFDSERENHLKSSVIVTPQSRVQNNLSPSIGGRGSPISVNAVPKTPSQVQYRRRLGRSPSPPARMANEQTRATNTPSSSQKFLVKDASKSALKEVFSRLKLTVATCRDGSLGAASLGASRDAPKPRQAPSVRSDERPLATQGDLLNSIKFQRRLRDTWTTDKLGPIVADKNNVGIASGRPSIKTMNSRTSNLNNKLVQCPLSAASREGTNAPVKSFFSPPRPLSPKGRSRPQPSNLY